MRKFVVITSNYNNKNFVNFENLWWEGPEFLKLKNKQSLEFVIPDNNFDAEVRKTTSMCLSLNAENLACNSNII